MIIEYDAVATWLNANQGVVGVALFLITISVGWLTGIFQALRRRPKFRFRLISGPTFVCTFGIAKFHNEYQVHRTGIALYVDVSNVGSAPSAIADISIGYHWAIQPISRNWFRYFIGWFWLREQAICIQDFQVEIGENTKFYPFLVQRSTISGQSADTYLEIGKSAIGVVYFEQSDSWGACFPFSISGQVRMKIVIHDAFGGRHAKKFWVPKIALSEARKFNPTFGETFSSLRGEDIPFELAVDSHGNILPPDSQPARST